MARYSWQYLEVLQVPMAVIAMDIIGHLPITSNGNRWALTAIAYAVLMWFAVLMKERSAENVVQAYLSGILVPKGGSVGVA